MGFEVGVWVDKPHLWLEDLSVALLYSQALGEVGQLFYYKADFLGCGLATLVDTPFPLCLLNVGFSLAINTSS